MTRGLSYKNKIQTNHKSSTHCPFPTDLPPWLVRQLYYTVIPTFARKGICHCERSEAISWFIRKQKRLLRRASSQWQKDYAMKTLIPIPPQIVHSLSLPQPIFRLGWCGNCTTPSFRHLHVKESVIASAAKQSHDLFVNKRDCFVVPPRNDKRIMLWKH
jgi:hypothetical protein